VRGASGPLRLRHRVLDSVRRHQLWRPGERVVVACSGGRDSVVLLDLLVTLQSAHGGKLQVLTVDHGIRADSAADAAFVAELATDRGLRCDVVVADGGDDEAAMRRARRAAYAAVVADGGVVATAHHRRDQAETVVLQLLRGAGSAGRRGMRWRAGSVVRPLLDTPPGSVAAWAEARGLRWRDDPTNRSDRYLRNRVRHEVLPLLEDLRPGAEATLARSAGHAADDEELLAALAVEAAEAHAVGGGLDAGWIADGPAALVRRVLRIRWPALGRGGVDAVVAAARRGRGVVELSEGAVEVREGVVRSLPPVHPR